MSLFVPPVNSNCFNITTCFMVTGKGTRMFEPFTPSSDRDRISPYNIKQAGDENREEYQLWDY